MGRVNKLTAFKWFRFQAALALRSALLFCLSAFLALMLTTGQCSAAQEKPANANSISMARATWDTGWFQTEIVRQLLEALGYVLSEPQTMDNLEFYLSAAKGDVDLWANGWFPSHDAFLEGDRVRGRVQAVGFEVKAGALQGYLVDKKTADALNLKRLSDFKNTDIAAVFDANGNGKADLIGCNVGWGCERVVEHHLDAYQLRATVEHVQGDYSPTMAETVLRYKQGKPVFFYTWTPNWTVGTLVPGKDVIWLEVPFASLPGEGGHLQERSSVRGVPGCPSEPCAMGFPPNDIRVVANTEFLDTHPDVRQLLQLVEIPLADISRQNAKMLEGEDTYEEIRRHAAEWIHHNRVAIDRWLKAAVSLQVPLDTAGQSARAVKTGGDRRVLRLVTQRSEPFVIYQDRKYTGFSIELWDKITQRTGLDYQIYGVNTIAKLLDDVKRGAADVAISGIGITSGREQDLDFFARLF
jgi:ABC-type proline/glycine betaine transport system substrate-binding protein